MAFSTMKQLKQGRFDNFAPCRSCLSGGCSGMIVPFDHLVCRLSRYVSRKIKCIRKLGRSFRECSLYAVSCYKISKEPDFLSIFLMK
jgi:hypothetical protein